MLLWHFSEWVARWRWGLLLMDIVCPPTRRTDGALKGPAAPQTNGYWRRSVRWGCRAGTAFRLWNGNLHLPKISANLCQQSDESGSTAYSVLLWNTSALWTRLFPYHPVTRFLFFCICSVWVVTLVLLPKIMDKAAIYRDMSLNLERRQKSHRLRQRN